MKLLNDRVIGVDGSLRDITARDVLYSNDFLRCAIHAGCGNEARLRWPQVHLVKL